jgi:hypothetical protein
MQLPTFSAAPSASSEPTPSVSPAISTTTKTARDRGLGIYVGLSCLITDVIGQDRPPWRDATWADAATAVLSGSRLSGNCRHAGG